LFLEFAGEGAGKDGGDEGVQFFCGLLLEFLYLQVVS
jgi:hypothetical protein